ncbi:peptide transporter [Methanobacterium alkalithermotolerans]|uniref:dolichyl-phosphooligosaccharide-protein glycotransferase n=1 Tax=Methanobacterium alkalithermotolerans TaxID=2731220 RepID=A0A8T8K7R9_9EURY|nr:STT3 domain-containing protein [Methanobacterium alkalithermotolerans]QUH23882.1 peptide transporter [Methanobacterium alkalithermotolerans]
MSKKKLIITLTSIFLIVSIALFFRIESVNLPGVGAQNQEFYRDFEGKPYMYELDSYYNYRLTRNYIENGHLGDKIINGQEWDSYSYSPPGVPMDYPPMLIYITAYIYHFINYFVTIPLLNVAFWLPLLISPLAGIAVYFFVKRFSNNTAGIVAGILTVITPFYLLRTIPGWFDTDMFNVLFPVLVVWCFIEALQADNIKKKAFYASISSILMLFFSMAWNGWQYIFYIIIFFTLFYIIWGLINGKNVKEYLFVLCIFAGGSLLLILIFFGIIEFLKPFYGLLELFNLVGTNPWSPWPDLYIMVSELQRPSIGEIISELGLVLPMGIMGIFLTFRILTNNQMKKIYLGKMRWSIYSLLVIWTLLGFISLLKGARFILLLIPPLSILAGIAVGILFDYLNNIFKNNKIRKIAYCILIIFILSPQLIMANESLNYALPMSNDDIWNSAQWIRNNTSNDTLIISDWSYGHFFSAIAERPVAFDGRSAYVETIPTRQFYDSDLTFDEKIPNTSREYWISRAFSTSNETLSAGIFRMLANRGDSAYLTLDEYTHNTTKTVLILNEILGIDKALASEVLINKYNLTEKQSVEILKFTHPDKLRPFIVLTYDRMINTGYWNFYFGNWDFEEEKGGNYTYSVGNFDSDNPVINSTNEVIFDLEKGDMTWENQEPYCVIEIKQENIKRRYVNSKSNFCIVILWDDEKTVVMDKKFENSLFTKLVLQKENTENFETIYKNKKVVLWKVTSY